ARAQPAARRGLGPGDAGAAAAAVRRHPRPRLGRRLQPEPLEPRPRAAVRRRHRRLHDAHLRRAAGARRARPDPRSPVGAAVPARPGHRRRGSLRFRHAADLRDAAVPCVRRPRRPACAAPLPAVRGRDMMDEIYDVAVLGGGNAGLCAALTAREAGASVIVVESAPRHFRGGNSRHTRNLRSAHLAPTGVQTDAYPEDEFLADLLRVSGEDTNEALARLVVSHSAGCPAWMQQHGARFQSSLRGTLHLGRTNAFFLGGGKALMNSYYAAAERLGIRVMYDTEVVGL